MIARMMVLPVLLALNVSACIYRKPVSVLAAQTAVDTVTLEVENHNWSDINIYLQRGTQRTRLGTVPAVSSTTLLIPSRVFGEVGTVRLMVYRIGGKDRFVSDALSVRMLSYIQLTVESDLEHSTVGIY